MRIGVGGAWKSASVYIGVGGAWKTVQTSIGVGGAWKSTEGGGGGLSLDVSPASRSVAGPAGTLTTATTTATPTGGTAPYTYSWARISGDTEISMTASTSATTAGTGTVGSGDLYIATFRCTVTDSLGATASDTCVFTLTETS